MRECFEDEHEGPDGPMGLDAETTQCIVNLVRRVPSSPQDLTNDEKRLIGRECFGGQRGGEGETRARPVAHGLSEETTACILDLIGHVPTDPNELSNDEKRRIGQECFQKRRTTSLSGQQTGQVLTVQPTTSDEQPDQGSYEQPSQESSGEQATDGVDLSQLLAGLQSTGDVESSQESDGQQQEAEEETEATAPELVLTESQREIQELIEERNLLVEEMEVTAVIGRLAGHAGSLTKGIKVLTIVNHLVLKGKEVSNEEWEDVFEKLEELDLD